MQKDLTSCFVFLVAALSVLVLGSLAQDRTENKNKILLSSGDVDITNSLSITKLLLQDPRRDVKLKDGAKRQFLVHVRHPVEEDVQMLIEAKLGNPVVGYLPENTFLVQCTLQQVVSLTELSQVLWVGDYKPQYKISKDLLLDEVALNSNRVEVGALNVKLVNFYGRVSISEIAKSWEITILEKQLASAVKIYVGSQTNFVVRASFTDAKKTSSMAALTALVSWIAKQYETNFVEPLYIEKPLNKFASGIVQSGYAIPREQGAFSSRNLKGQGQVVSVLDTGIDYGNCYFKDSVDPKLIRITKSSLDPWANYISTATIDNTHRKIVGYMSFDTLLEQSDSLDAVYGHGTHVAGSIAGKCQTEEGAGFNGVASEAKIAFIDVQTNYGGNSGSGLSIPAIDELGLAWPHKMAGARIHSHSWGSSTNGYNFRCIEFDTFLYKYNTSTAFIAAGNEGVTYGPGSINNPAAAKNVIAVGASLNANGLFQELKYSKYWKQSSEISPTAAASNPTLYSQDAVAGFSSRGPTSDGRNKPDIIAPGYYVISARSSGDPTTTKCNFNYLNATTTTCLNDCSGNGNCVVSSFGDISCSCYTGYCGSDCSIRVSSPNSAACCNNNCNYNGDCSISRCNCNSGYYGRFCENAAPKGSNNGFNTLYLNSGTSMATPIAAGMGAIVRQYFMEGYYPTGRAVAGNSIEPTNALMKALFVNSARPVSRVVAMEYDYTKFGNFFYNAAPLPVTMSKLVMGYGLIGMNRTLKFDDSSHNLYITQSKSLKTGEEHTFCFQTTGSFDLVISLAWTDPPSVTASSKHLINDLDLEVIAGGKQYFGNGNTITLKNYPNQVFAVPDDKNNVEQVSLQSGTGDKVKVIVRGYNVPVNSPQAYALVITGMFGAIAETNISATCPSCYEGQKISCADSDGSGFKYCVSGSYGTCTYETCNTGLSLFKEQNSCVPINPKVRTSVSYVNIQEGKVASYKIALASQPTSSVTVTATVSDSGSRINIKKSADPSFGASTTVTFTTQNYATPQALLVTHPADNIDIGDYSGFISYTTASADSNYDNLILMKTTVKVEEVDKAAIAIASPLNAAFGLAAQAAANTKSLSVSLSSKPTAAVQLSLTSYSSNVKLGTQAAATVLQFDSTNWSVPQQISISTSTTAPTTFTVVNIPIAVISSDVKYNNLRVAPLIVALEGNATSPTPTPPTPTPTPIRSPVPSPVPPRKSPTTPQQSTTKPQSSPVTPTRSATPQQSPKPQASPAKSTAVPVRPIQVGTATTNKHSSLFLLGLLLTTMMLLIQ